MRRSTRSGFGGRLFATVARLRRAFGTRAGAAVLVLAAAAVLIVAVLVTVVRVPPGPPPAVVSGTLSVNASATRIQLAPTFWGADGSPLMPYGAAQAGELRSTPVRTVVWPGGGAGDGYNATANLYTGTDGSRFPFPTDEAGFVAWCRSVNCTGVIELPGELDNPWLAASEVAYTERTLGFHPAYWEVGNEPAAWSEFGIPWISWTATNAFNATPGAYANVVREYTSAIRAVDPTARVLGLPGTGLGASSETAWIRASVAENGPNLSGVGIHVYPAFQGRVSSPGLAGFFDTLLGNGSLLKRVPADREAVHTACRACGPIPLFVTELGSATVRSGYYPFAGTFAEAVYLAAEIVQAMELNLTSVDLYALQSDSYAGSLFTPAGDAREAGTLYVDVLPALGPTVLYTALSLPARNVYALTTLSASGAAESLLLVNANVSAIANLTVAPASLPSLSTGVDLAWNTSSARPVTTNRTGPPPTHLVLPPESLRLLTFESVPAGGARNLTRSETLAQPPTSPGRDLPGSTPRGPVMQPPRCIAAGATASSPLRGPAPLSRVRAKPTLDRRSPRRARSRAHPPSGWC